MSNREMSNHEEAQIIQELEREADRKGGLFALMACLAVAAGLALASVLAMTGGG